MNDIQRNTLEKILLSENIEEYTEQIVDIIPEVQYMIGFDHKHPHHHLDVWNHTLEALRNIEDTDMEVRIGVLLHDIGKPFSYQVHGENRHFKGHPEVSAQMAEVILKRLSYDDKFVNDVCYLVRTHDTIINPDKLDNSYDMITKRLEIQYADAKAHAPSKIKKRLDFLDDISNKLLDYSKTEEEK